MKYYNDSGEEMVLVRKSWFDAQSVRDECPFCGSANLYEKPADDTFDSRRRCLDCDNWFEPQLQKMRLKR